VLLCVPCPHELSHTHSIVKLGTGDVVPAERCVKADDFRVNEMLLTGEPEDVAKGIKVRQEIKSAARFCMALCVEYFCVCNSVG